MNPTLLVCVGTLLSLSMEFTFLWAGPGEVAASPGTPFFFMGPEAPRGALKATGSAAMQGSSNRGRLLEVNLLDPQVIRERGTNEESLPFVARIAREIDTKPSQVLVNPSCR